ncbi:histidine--tRNA ligase [candidate division WWE3 bacterium]|uniref:Histidine--tRNA ligase n=1 Tax=candidate division WWE3 bacterium TaxID=2053526 RepID=A0A955LGU6_UNCKA|nr:histidine--tRNA ligase [candidate division WWE3 bacterium]
MSKSNVLSNQPYRGTQDFFPEEMRIRRFIFDTWRSVCEAFGYEEYQTPLLEEANLYRAKSGDEVGGKELFTLTDLKGRELAIRPEMTPSVTRMVSRKINELPKPVRLFNISNFMRQERPQRGRNREFWQLNFDVFGTDAVSADLEILLMAISIMQRLGAPEGSFKVYLNSRKLLNAFVDRILGSDSDQKSDFVRILDKYEKMDPAEFEKTMTESFALESASIHEISQWMSGNFEASQSWLNDQAGYQEVTQLLSMLKELGYEQIAEFRAGLVRGFDYYDGMIFEVFDTNPENSRSLFGGGRYNGLASLFGVNNFPAVGCAPGDETLALFIKTWNIEIGMAETTVLYIPQLTESVSEALTSARVLRSKGLSVVSGLEKETISQALSTANKRNYRWVLLIGEDEIVNKVYTIKNLETGEQQECPSLEDVFEMIQSSSEASE